MPAGNEINEQKIVWGCRRGENDSRRQLYDIYARQMMKICYRYTGDMPVSEDLLHDGFLKVFESIDSFEYRGADSLKAWMSKIFVNIVLQYLRKNSLREEISIDEWEEPETVPEETYDLIPTDVLMQMIRELPVKYRTVFNLYTFEDYSHREIAARLDMNESTSRSQLTRARAMLLKKINAYTHQHG